MASERAADEIRTAVLLAASPDQVYKELLAERRKDGYPLGWIDHAARDKALVARKNPLITLAVAQSTTESDLLSEIYQQAVADQSSDERAVLFNMGLRLACLSNPARSNPLSELDTFATLDEVARIAKEGSVAEYQALIQNPSATKILCQLLSRKGVFASLEDDRWLWLVHAAAFSERLNFDDSDEHGPDMGASDVRKAVVKLAAAVPVSKRGAKALIAVLERCHKWSHAESKEQRDEVLARWTEWEYVESKEELSDSWHVPDRDLKAEVVALLGAVVNSYGTKDAQGKFGSVSVAKLDSDDLAERCGAYSIERLNSKQIEAGVRRDNDAFFLSVMRNAAVLGNRDYRIFIEEHLSRRLAWLYKYHCELLKRRRPDFDAAPQSESMREDEGVTIDPVTQRIDAVAMKVARLEVWLKGIKAWIIWGTIIVVTLLLWRR